MGIRLSPMPASNSMAPLLSFAFGWGRVSYQHLTHSILDTGLCVGSVWHTADSYHRLTEEKVGSEAKKLTSGANSVSLPVEDFSLLGACCLLPLPQRKSRVPGVTILTQDHRRPGGLGEMSEWAGSC